VRPVHPVRSGQGPFQGVRRTDRSPIVRIPRYRRLIDAPGIRRRVGQPNLLVSVRLLHQEFPLRQNLQIQNLASLDF